MGVCRPLLVLLWKNWRLHRRHFILTFIELIFPIAISSYFAYYSITNYIKEDEYVGSIPSSKIKHRNSIFYDPYNLSERYYSIRPLLYAPNTNSCHSLIKTAFEKEEYFGGSKGFESEKDIENYVLHLPDTSNYYYYEIKSAIFSQCDSSSNVFKYKLRFCCKKFDTEKTYGNKDKILLKKDDWSRTAIYTSTDFIKIQKNIDLAFIKMKNISTEKKKMIDKFMINSQPMPYPENEYVYKQPTIFDIMPTFLVLGFIIIFPLIVKRIVEEKCSRTKEMLKMMGINDLTYWGGTFINNLALLLFIILFITLIFSIKFVEGISVLGHVSSALFFVLLLLYSIASLLFCFSITTVFNKPSFAVIATIVLWIISYALPLILLIPANLNDPFPQLSLLAKLFSCLLPSVGLHWGCLIISSFINLKGGMYWKEFLESPTINGDGFCMGSVFGMITISCLLYIILIWYLDSVWPWQPGIPKPFYFCFLPSYWLKCYKKIENIPEVETTFSPYFEKEPKEFERSVIISHLTKKFRSGIKYKTAVNDVSLNLYSGQITVLLGPNGAGKTTIMNIITGIFKPNFGTVLIHNKNIATETAAARKNIGLCPQHNTFCNSLNVEETLRFFAGLKNMTWSDIKTNTNEILDLLQLQEKRNSMIKELSEGMKRKLSLGIAIIGGSKLLVLDEPTSGMDPKSRRVVWDALLKLRKDRTIFLTTHHMEEADALGDRIAIMSGGCIKCCGSSIFLKGRFGTGYHLHIAKSDNCNVDEITRRIKIHVSDVNIISNINQKLVYSLSSMSQSFPELFKILENSYSELGIISCGITVTTMEDVFLKVENTEKKNYEDISIYNENGYISEYQNNFDVKLLCSSKISGIRLLLQQMKGLFIKRFNYAKHNCIMIILQILLPFFLILLLFWIDSMTYSNIREGPVVLNLNTLYGSTNAFYNLKSKNEIMNSLSDNYKKLLESENANVTSVKNDTEFLIEESKNVESYLKNNLVGATFLTNDSKNIITSWFNGINHHLQPISLNLITTAILRYVTEDSKSDIEIINHPLSLDANIDKYKHKDLQTKVICLITVSMAVTVLSSFFVIFPQHERISKAKFLQRLCGVNGIIYWMMNFFWDLMLFMFSSFILLLPLFVFHAIHLNVNNDVIGILILILLLYGWASIPFSYLISFISNNIFTNFSLYIIINLFTGMFLGILAIFFKESTKALKLLFRISKMFPVFSVSLTITNIHEIIINNILCSNFEEPYKICDKENRTNYFSCCSREICENECLQQNIQWESLFITDFIPLICDGIIYFIILILMETVLPILLNKCIRILKKRTKPKIDNFISLNKDLDVSNEDIQFKINKEVLVVNDLTKYFNSFCAVNNLTFSVHKSECFGLLGINGAGKTLTFQMLTGGLIPSWGDAGINGFTLQMNKEKYQKNIGYCPQFDALIDHLTGREMLILFANLRGINPNHINLIVEKTIEFCDLDEHADKTTETYSGGTKRKLSLGLAIIGLPEIIILDQPTSGVDPKSRRMIWKIILIAKQLLKKSVLISSHNMNECEALCDRIAIMVNGQFYCLDSLQNLGSKFGQGYTLIVKMDQSNEENKIIQLRQFIENSHPTAVLKDAHQDVLRYHIPDTSLKLSRIFSFMEEVKQKFSLEDYLISDTTLEQIFLEIVTSKTEEVYHL